MLYLKKYKSLILILFIVFIATFLRLYQLGNNPPSLTWDEAAWGYNAYSLGTTGHDEFGKLPIVYLESFGDYKPPVYAYLDVLPVKFFGVNEFATRFPSAIFGILTVFITYFLVKRIFWKSKNSENYALISMFILAISPWHIMLSRAAFEANVATFFLASGIWLFLGAIQSNKWYLILSAISFVISMNTFNTSRVFAPLIVVILTFAFRNQLWKIKREVILASLVGIVLFIPLFFFLLTPQSKTRFQEVNIFSDPSIVKISNQEIANDHGAVWSKIIHNRRVLYSLEYFKHYFDNLSPLFLFIRGDGNPKFSIQSVGEAYIWESIFIIGGVLLLFKKKEGEWWIIPIWLLAGIIPAATARETPHALRIETTLPTVQILAAYGLYNMLEPIKKRIYGLDLKFVAIGLVVIACLLNFAYFEYEYYNHYPQEFSAEWQYGYKDSIAYVRSVQNKYDYIQVTNSLGRPYIYYLFYSKTLSQDFINSAKIKRDPFGFVTVESFGKYLFPDDFNYKISSSKKVLYINTPFNLPKNIKILKTFNTLDGKPALVAYTI